MATSAGILEISSTGTFQYLAGRYPWSEQEEKQLEERGILYAPDYCVNSGGVIQVADELDPSGFDFDRAKARATGIYDTTLAVLERAAAEGVPPSVAADREAERRIREVGRLRSVLLPRH